MREVAETLGLQDLLERKPGQLSGGQRQRVALGRALLREPEAFLMDEPLSNLDAALRVQMRVELSRLHDRFKATTVYVTHDQIEAMTMGDRIAVMNGGRLQQCDTPGAPLRATREPVRRRVHRRAEDEPRRRAASPSAGGAPAIELARAGRCRSMASSPSAVAAARGAAVTVGLRPEDLRWSRDAPPSCSARLHAQRRGRRAGRLGDLRRRARAARPR